MEEASEAAGLSQQEAARLEELNAAIARLEQAGDITPLQAADLRQALPQQYPGSRYVLKHFGAHLSIGVVFAFDVVPLPLGTMARVGWVCLARLTETLRGNFARARVHSLPVLLVAAIPWVGYVAYLLPLRRHSRSLAFVLANESWLQRRGHSYEAFVRRRTRVGARLARWLVPLPWPDAKNIAGAENSDA